MTYGEILKDFLKKTILPIVIALCLFLMFKNVFTENGKPITFYVAMLWYSLWYSSYVRMARTAWLRHSRDGGYCCPKLYF